MVRGGPGFVLRGGQVRPAAQAGLDGNGGSFRPDSRWRWTDLGQMFPIRRNPRRTQTSLYGRLRSAPLATPAGARPPPIVSDQLAAEQELPDLNGPMAARIPSPVAYP